MARISLDEFLSMRIRQRCQYFIDDKRLLALVYAQQFDRDLLDNLFGLADAIRRLSESNDGRLFLRTLLADRRAMLYFTQPSTRTFLSFAAACEILGMSTADVRDAATSSEIKGESREDALRIFSLYHDLIIMRQPKGGFCEKIAFQMLGWPGHKPIINAGSGMDQHPTQALLDLYTLQRCFADSGGLDRKRIMLVGDLKRGRTARSLAYLLSNYKDVELILAAPAELTMNEDIKEHLQENGVPFVETDDMQPYLGKVDAIYMTRIQDEWDGGAKTSMDYGRFGLRAEQLKELKKDCFILHPLPRRQEIETSIDGDRRAVYFEQAENGMWVRAALIAHMFGVDDEILSR